MYQWLMESRQPYLTTPNVFSTIDSEVALVLVA